MQELVVMEAGVPYSLDMRSMLENFSDEFDLCAIAPGKGYSVGKDFTVIPEGTGEKVIRMFFYDKENDGYYTTYRTRIYSYDVSEFTPVSNAQELDAIRNDFDGNYILTADIDLAGIDWQPIGQQSNNPHKSCFCGNFINPYGYAIKNLTVFADDDSDYHQLGLFSQVGYNAFIYGLKLENVNIGISDTVTHVKYAGGIAGEAYNSFLIDCSVSGNISSNYLAGGLIGYSAENKCIDGCSFSGNVSAVNVPSGSNPETPTAGGLFGDCTARPSYHDSIDNMAIYQSIRNCTARGTVNATTYAGGIAGTMALSHYVTNCSFSGTVDGEYSSNDYGIIYRT